MRTCVRMIIAVLLPRFSLLVALSGGRQELVGRPLALAPELGRAQFIGETSPAAEVHGVRAGMRLGEAMARCPQLALVPPDPAGVGDTWERVLAGLESIGAAIEPGAPGAVCFDASGLLGLHGGIDGVLRASRRALDRPARLAAAPSRFAALAAAARARARRPVVVHFARPFLASLPIDLLSLDGRTAALVEPFERLGIRTLGELAALPRAKVADRFGTSGLTAGGSWAPGGEAGWGGRRRARAAPADAAAARAAGPARVSLRPGARAGAGAARRPPARPPRTARTDDPRRRARGDPGRGRHLARADGVPRGARRPGAHADRAGAAAAGAARPGRGARGGGR